MNHILCVDDNDLILQLVSRVLEASGHHIELAHDGDEALQKIAVHEPNLIVLDWEMPRLSGLEVCHAVKGNPFTARIPILMLTAQDEIEDKVEGFEAGADDYLAKPFHPRELQARVEALLRLVHRESDRNPSSGLPGARAVRAEIERRAAGHERFAICYIDLDHFKPFADTFGFDVADSVIERTGTAICDAILEVGAMQDSERSNNSTPSQETKIPAAGDRRKYERRGTVHFAGHIGGDDFLVITDPRSAEHIARACAVHFRAVIAEVLGEKALAQGYFTGVDREGHVRDFPIAGITSAIVVVDPATWISTAHIGAFAAELKRNAKNSGTGLSVQIV